MALFRRKKTLIPDVPPEMQDYYQTDSPRRTGMAWLLALGTLLITVVVILGLFFGGRLVFRKLKHTNKPTNVATRNPTSTQKTTKPSPDKPTPSSSSSSGTTSTTTTPSNTGTSSTYTTTPSSTSPTSTSPSSAETTPSPSSTSAQAATAADLPRTGPADNLAIFVVVSLIAYIAHRKFRSPDKIT